MLQNNVQLKDLIKFDLVITHKLCNIKVGDLILEATSNITVRLLKTIIHTFPSHFRIFALLIIK